MKAGIVTAAVLSAAVLLPASAGAVLVDPEVVKPQVVTPVVVTPQPDPPRAAADPAPAVPPVTSAPAAGRPQASSLPAAGPSPASSAPQDQPSPEGSGNGPTIPTRGRGTYTGYFPSGTTCAGSMQECREVYDIEHGWEYDVWVLGQVASDAWLSPLEAFVDQFFPDYSPAPDSSPASDNSSVPSPEEDCQCSFEEEPEGGAGGPLWFEDPPQEQE